MTIRSLLVHKHINVETRARAWVCVCVCVCVCSHPLHRKSDRPTKAPNRLGCPSGDLIMGAYHKRLQRDSAVIFSTFAAKQMGDSDAFSRPFFTEMVEAVRVKGLLPWFFWQNPRYKSPDHLKLRP